MARADLIVDLVRYAITGNKPMIKKKLLRQLFLRKERNNIRFWLIK